MSALQVVLWYRNLMAKALLGTRPIILKQMPLFTVPFFVVFLPLFSERSSSSGLRNGATRIWIGQHIVDDLAELSEVEGWPPSPASNRSRPNDCSHLPRA
jgi:hypothetical protein